MPILLLMISIGISTIPAQYDDGFVLKPQLRTFLFLYVNSWHGCSCGFPCKQHLLPRQVDEPKHRHSLKSTSYHELIMTQHEYPVECDDLDPTTAIQYLEFENSRTSESVMSYSSL
jgi:hypothetical protein